MAQLNLPHVTQARDRLPLFFAQANSVILDKSTEIRLALCCLLAGGHLLIEDVPGVGKTTLVKLFAKLLNLDFKRVQFTNDLLPADILGNMVYLPHKNEFEFHAGPMMAQLVLGDELNRASPKTQSACLQAMEEHQVSIDGQNHALPKPFFFIATQNPRKSIGTFPLPESQLDRFLMRIHLGILSRAAERELLLGASRQHLIEQLKPVFSPQDILHLQHEVTQVRVSTALVDYVLDLIAHTRHVSSGLSPRAALGLLNAARSWAYCDSRSFVVPEDVQAVAPSIMAHRLEGGPQLASVEGRHPIVQQILSSVPVK